MPTVSLTSLTSPSFSNRMKPPHEDLPTTLLSLSSHQLKDSVLALFLSPSFIPFLPLFFKPVSTVTDDESRATFMFVLSVVERVSFCLPRSRVLRNSHVYLLSNNNCLSLSVLYCIVNQGIRNKLLFLIKVYLIT